MRRAPAKFDEFLFRNGRAFDVSIGPEETQRKSARANQAIEAADPAIRSLRLWNAGRFDPRLLARFKRLETLVVFCWPGDTLAPLSPLRTLRELGLMSFPKVRDLSPLATLTRLEHVELSIAMSEVSLQKVQSLAPLWGLKRLRILSAYTMMPQERDFPALARSSRLAYVHLGDWLSLEQRADLVARGIAERGELFQTPVNCAKCDGFRVYLYGLASRRKWYCTRCHADLIAAHRAGFNALLEEASAQMSGRAAVKRASRR